MSTQRCLECGETEDAHHAFQPVVLPPACVCDAESWGDPLDIPAICAAYAPKPDEDDYCKNCNHDAGCHSPAARGETPGSGTPTTKGTNDAG